MSNRILPINERTNRMAALMERSAALRDQLEVAFKTDEIRKLMDERDALQNNVLEIYREAFRHYSSRGFGMFEAEMSASLDYVRARDMANENHINTIPAHERIFKWLDYAADKVMENLQDKITRFNREEPPTDEAALKKYEGKKRRYALMERLIEREPNPGKRGNEVRRIVRGYLTEFVNQTEHQLHACNIANEKNPKEKAYWETRPVEEFEKARCAGLMHTAFSFSRVKSVVQTRNERRAAWEATGDIIGACIQTFKAEYPRYDQEANPMASVFNDHMKTFAHAYRLEDMFGTSKPLTL